MMSQRYFSKQSLSMALVTLLILSVIIVPVGFAQNNKKDYGYDWSNHGYDKQVTNFSPQNQITKENIATLRDVWTSAYSIPPANPGVDLRAGVSARPLIIDGVGYQTTNFFTNFATMVDSGTQLWGYLFPINISQVQVDTPSINPWNKNLGVIEASSVYGENLMIPTPDCGILMLNLITGKPSFVGELTQGQICSQIEGNEGKYTGQIMFAPSVYEDGKVLITGTGVSGKVESGRGFVAGFDADSGNLLWRFFLMPPAGGEKNWAMEYSGKGNVEPTSDDWGNARGVGVGIGAGQYAVDEETGIVYVGTSAPAPNYNGTNRPGPNLFSSSILALDALTGELIWYYQTSTHDVYGHGCEGSTTLGRIDNKKVVFKACENGKVYALDAANGEEVWVFTPPSVLYHNVEYQEPADDYFNTSPDTSSHWQCPGITGASGGDLAFAYGKIYYVATNYCDYIEYTPVGLNDLESDGAILPDSYYAQEGNTHDYVETMPKNSTVYGINIEDGTADWQFEIPKVAHVGGLIATGDLVILGSLDGHVYALDAENGNIVFDKSYGTPISTTPIIGASAGGQQHLFLVMGGTPDRFGQELTGLLLALTPRGEFNLADYVEDEGSSESDQGTLPSGLVIPAIGLVILVFLIAAFGPSIRKKDKKTKT